AAPARIAGRSTEVTSPGWATRGPSLSVWLASAGSSGRRMRTPMRTAHLLSWKGRGPAAPARGRCLPLLFGRLGFRPAVNVPPTAIDLRLQLGHRARALRPVLLRVRWPVPATVAFCLIRLGGVHGEHARLEQEGGRMRPADVEI